MRDSMTLAQNAVVSPVWLVQRTAVSSQEDCSQCRTHRVWKSSASETTADLTVLVSDVERQRMSDVQVNEFVVVEDRSVTPLW